MLQEKQYYLKCLAEKTISHRAIANRMSTRFNTSPAAVKNLLLQEGLIEFSHYTEEGVHKKRSSYYKLTKKNLNSKPVPVSTSPFWEDGTPKSRNNAFDLSTARGLFNKSELAASQNKGKPNNYNTPVQVIAYSRA